MSKKVALSADNNTASVAEAGNLDCISTLLDSDVAVTGTQKYLQIGLAFGAGLIYGNKRHTGELFNFG